MSAPKVSFIVPVLGEAEGLQATLGSLFAQTFSEFEIICVDGGPEGHASTAIQKCAKSDSRLHLVRRDCSTPGEARNLGLSCAQGDYVAFVDPGVSFDPCMLERAVAAAASTKADIVVFGYSRLWDGGQEEHESGFREEWLPDDAMSFNWATCPDRIMSILDPTSWNKLHRKAFLEEKQLCFDEISTCSELSFVAVTAASASRIALVREVLASCACPAVADGAGGDVARQQSLDDRAFAIASATRQALALPQASEISKSIEYFCVSEYLAPFRRCAKDASSPKDGPEVERYYEGMRQVFLDARFDAVGEADLEDDALFCRFRIVHQWDFARFRELCSRRLIVSCTSYPARIAFVAQVLETIYAQSFPADEVVLWLAEEQFPAGDDELPADLRQLIAEGRLTLRWCPADLKPHKKYFWAFQEYPDDLVVTIDDDLLYEPTLLERLVDSYLLFPKAISATRVHLMVVDEERKLLPYNDWPQETDASLHEPSMQLFSTNGAGALYPPHLLDASMLDEEAICATCLSADDVWLKAMALVSEVPVVCAVRHQPLVYVPGSQMSGLYLSNLDEGGNDASLERVSAWVDARFGEGTFMRELTSSGVGVQLLGVKTLLRHETALRERCERRDLGNCTTGRVDVKNAGADSNDLELLEISDVGARVWGPPRFAEGSRGYVVQSEAGELCLRLRCVGSGVLRVGLRGAGVLDADGKPIPFWIDFTKFQVDGKLVFEGVESVWHDHPFRFEKKVRDGEVVELSLAWEPHDERRSARELEERAAAERRLEAAQGEAAAERGRADRAAAEVERMRASTTWKAGRAVTWLPRKLKRAVRKARGGGGK